MPPSSMCTLENHRDFTAPNILRIEDRKSTGQRRIEDGGGSCTPLRQIQHTQGREESTKSFCMNGGGSNKTFPSLRFSQQAPAQLCQSLTKGSPCCLKPCAQTPPWASHNGAITKELRCFLVGILGITANFIV